MKKKTNTRRFTFNANVLRNLLIGYSILASTFALFLLVTFLPAYQSQQAIFGDANFKQAVRDMQLSVYDKPQLLAAEHRLYFPDLKITVPAGENYSQLLYQYEAGINDQSVTTPESASFASKSTIYNTSKTMSQLICSRLADVTMNEKQADRGGENFTVEAEVRLDDGRTMYIYQNKSPQCVQVWSGLNAEQVVQMLKQAQSIIVN